MGKRIVAAVGSGDVASSSPTPGSANLQPRIEGAEKAIKDSGAPITIHTVATGAADRASKRRSKPIGPATNTKGMYAVDGGDTAELAKVMQKFGLAAKGVKAGGFDLTEKTQKLLKEGNIEFTIDQQPYLQGFLPILQLFLWHVSGSLTGPAEVDTGPEVPQQRNGHAVRRIEIALRGDLLRSEGHPDPGGHGSLADSGGRGGSGTARRESEPPAERLPAQPAAGVPRAARVARGELLERVLSLREGSIIS